MVDGGKRDLAASSCRVLTDVARLRRCLGSSRAPRARVRCAGTFHRRQVTSGQRFATRSPVRTRVGLNEGAHKRRTHTHSHQLSHALASAVTRSRTLALTDSRARSSKRSREHAHASLPHHHDTFIPLLRTGRCEDFDPAADLRSLPNPEWCNGNSDRRNSKSVCEAAHVTVYATRAGRKMRRCVHNAAAKQCKMQQEPVWCLRVPEPPVCEAVRQLTELRQRNEWCGSDPARLASKATCEKTYVRTWTGATSGLA
eukprot:6190038-Pleurochrysis_carterae.AAC.1